MTDNNNPVGLRGIEFTEFSSHDKSWLETIFKSFGFSKISKHNESNFFLYKQNDIQFILNDDTKSFSKDFEKQHGPCISSMGWKVDHAAEAFKIALSRGATAAEKQDYFYENGSPIPAIKGIGDSLIYFIDHNASKGDLKALGFTHLEQPELVEEKGFLSIDHLTNNVESGTMKKWSDFYKDIFGFTEVRYFDIRGAKTGLISYALQSPDKSFCIPINEGTESKSQINEYLREYKGAGVQHIAFLTNDILSSLDRLRNSPIKTLDIDDEYYQEVFQRVPNVTENRSRIREHNVLVDGDDKGYLLQIFTKNLIGPIFIEIIQRKNHHSFGEGNFGALFRSIERDQEVRGVL